MVVSLLLLRCRTIGCLGVSLWIYGMRREHFSVVHEILFNCSDCLSFWNTKRVNCLYNNSFLRISGLPDQESCAKNQLTPDGYTEPLGEYMQSSGKERFPCLPSWLKVSSFQEEGCKNAFSLCMPDSLMNCTWRRKDKHFIRNTLLF